MRGRTFVSTRRHGKYFFGRMDNRLYLMLHFGMTGYLSYLIDGEREPRHTRLLIFFTNGNRLAYVSQRMFGRISLVKAAGRTAYFCPAHQKNAKYLSQPTFAVFDQLHIVKSIVKLN